MTTPHADGMVVVMAGQRSFWTNARRRLIGKTLANLFLLLIGASATGEVVIGLPWWLKALLGVVIVAAGGGAVIVMPDGTSREDE